jgi:hypothetical protein
MQISFFSSPIYPLLRWFGFCLRKLYFLQVGTNIPTGRFYSMKSKLVKQAFQEKDDQDCDYYERWLLALEKMVLEIKLVSREEVENRTAQVSVK